MYVCTYFSHNTTSAHQANRQWQYIGVMVTASQPDSAKDLSSGANRNNEDKQTKNDTNMKESQVRRFRAYHNHYRKLKLHTSEA